MRPRRTAQSIDAPPCRYRVVEKNGRLVTIDNRSGTAVPSSLLLRAQAKDAPAPALPARPSKVDAAAALMVRLVVREWDAEGRAVIHLKRRRQGEEVSDWNALLDAEQQRRFGRALLMIGAAPLVILAGLPTGLPLLGFLAAVPLVISGSMALTRLRAETDLGPGA